MRARDRLTAAFGLLALLTATLAIGGGNRYVVVILALIAVAVSVTQSGSRRRLDGTSPLLVVLGAAVVLTALQLVPLPAGIREALGGTGHDLLVDGQALLGDASSLRPLSLDPAATLVELAKFCTYFLIGWMALRAASSDRGRARLLAAVAGTAGLVALIAIAHELLGATTLYAIYTPEHATPVVMAPLLNANHLACLMGLGAILAGGLALHERSVPGYRVVWVAVTLACLGVLLATRSRGGVIGFGAGAIVTSVMVVLQRLRSSGEGGRRDVLRIAVPAAVTVLCTLVLIVSIGGGKVQSELANTQLDELTDPRSKYAAWESSLELVKEAPILGIGRGAFETSFTRVHPHSARVTFSHVENEYLQALIDWGVVGALAFAIAFGLAVRILLRRWHRNALTATAIGALAVIAVQSLVDFGLELPGIAVPAVIIAATLLYVPLKESSRSPQRQLMRLGACAITAVVALIAGSPKGISVGEDHRALRDEPSLERAQESFARHPVDYLSAAIIGTTSPDSTTRVAFINQALRLHPTHPDLHLLVARWLAATKRFEQAALEYRLAMVRDSKTELLLEDLLARLPAQHVAGALPTGREYAARITKALIERKQLEIAIAYLTLVNTAGGRRDTEFWLQLHALSRQRGRADLALTTARQLAKLDPSTVATIRVAEAQVALADVTGALATLAPVISQPVTTTALVDANVLQCKILVETADWVNAKACLTKVIDLPNVPVLVRKLMHGQLAKVESALGDERAARLERELAGEHDPNAPKLIPPK